jgi:uracil-DNA glycosylase
MGLLRLAAHHVWESWKKHLSVEFGKPHFIKLIGFVAEDRKHYTAYPSPHQVFTWAQMCNKRCEVYHLGTGSQDPWWAKQGTLLNTVLADPIHQATCHKERGWEQFTKLCPG